jgi:hypothetical protein
MVRLERLHFQVSHLWHSFLSWAWRVCAVESRGVVGKWAQAEQEAPRRAIPDDYVEGLLTFVLHRLGATDVPWWTDFPGPRDDRRCQSGDGRVIMSAETSRTTVYLDSSDRKALSALKNLSRCLLTDEFWVMARDFAFAMLRLV